MAVSMTLGPTSRASRSSRPRSSSATTSRRCSRRTTKGDVKIIETDATERAWGAKAGAITGAVIGLVFPPSLLVAGAVGAGAGALAGNLMRGIKRKDIKEIGEMLDEGQAGVILVGFTTIEEGMDRLMKRAAKVMKQEVDAQAEELKAQIDEAVK